MTDAFVPDEHALYIFGPTKRPGPLYSFLNVIMKVGAVPLGIARRAIDVTTSAVYQPNALDQALRDLTTICQHIVMNSRTRITAGRVFLGLESQDLTFS